MEESLSSALQWSKQVTASQGMNNTCDYYETGEYMQARFVNQGKAKKKHFHTVLSLSLDPIGIVGKDLTFGLIHTPNNEHIHTIVINKMLFSLFVFMNSLRTY